MPRDLEIPVSFLPDASLVVYTLELSIEHLHALSSFVERHIVLEAGFVKPPHASSRFETSTTIIHLQDFHHPCDISAESQASTMIIP